MRPNALVTVDKGATITSILTENQIDNVEPNDGTITAISIASDAVITSSDHGLSQGDLVFISGSDSTPTVDGYYEITVIDSNSFSVNVTTSSTGSTGNWQLAAVCKSYTVNAIPTDFSTEGYFDFVQNTSPNKILKYDIKKNSINQNTSMISFRDIDVDTVVVGSHITVAEQTIVPNIPTELHPILAQRVAVACLEAMGDEQNKQSAERKLASMEKDANTFLDNRVEGASQKIKSRHSPLVNTLNTLGRRNRRW